MLNLRGFAVVVGISAVIAGLPVRAQTVPLQTQLNAAKATDGKPKLPLHGGASLTHSVGSGTFVLGSQNNPTVGSALTLNPSLTWEGFTVLVNQSFALEYTQSDYTTQANQIELSDTQLGLRYGRFSVDDWHLQIVPSLGVALPLSMASRNLGSVGGLSLGARAIYSLPDTGFSFYGSVSAGGTWLVPALSQRFNDQEARPFVDDTGHTLDALLCTPQRPGELNSYACLDGANPSAGRVGAGLGGSWSGFDGNLSVNVDLAYGAGYGARIFWERDALTAENASTGPIPRQVSSGNISVTWVALPWLYVTGGVSSQQSLFTYNCFADDKDSADACVAGDAGSNNQHPRLPFWDFETPRDNNSSMFVDTTVSF